MKSVAPHSGHAASRFGELVRVAGGSDIASCPAGPFPRSNGGRQCTVGPGPSASHAWTRQDRAHGSAQRQPRVMPTERLTRRLVCSSFYLFGFSRTSFLFELRAPARMKPMARV